MQSLKTRVLFFFFFSSTSLLLPTHLPPPSCTHARSCNPKDCSPPDSSVHGFFQARILEWVAISFSKTRALKWIISLFLSHKQFCLPESPSRVDRQFLLSGTQASSTCLFYTPWPFTSTSWSKLTAPALLSFMCRFQALRKWRHTPSFSE